MIDSGSLPPNIKRAMQRQPVFAKPEPVTEAPSFSFFVEGHPEPGGSKSSFVPTDKSGNPYRGPTGRIIVNTVDANPNLKKWKAIVAREARHRFTHRPFEGPVQCRFEFIVLRPKAHYGTGRNAEKIKDNAPQFPTVKPDTLKLARGTEDALTGICWIDDAQVVNQSATKRYGAVAGVMITVCEVTVIQSGRPVQQDFPLVGSVKPVTVKESDPLPF